MSQAHPILVPRAPLAHLSVAPTPGRGVIVCDRHGLGIAAVLARKGQRAALAERLREQLEIELPQGPRRSAASNLAMIGTGPGAWLAMQEHGGNGFAASLRTIIGDLAAVSDQSDAYAVLRLSAPKVRDTLAKLVPIDFHPRAFVSGDAAATVAAHLSVLLWRLEDEMGGSPIFDLAVYRSFVASFWQALCESAAEFGVEIARRPTSADQKSEPNDRITRKKTRDAESRYRMSTSLFY